MSAFNPCNIGSCDQIAAYSCSCGILWCKDHFLHHMEEEIPNHIASPAVIKLSDRDLQMIEPSSLTLAIIKQEIVYRNQAIESLFQQMKEIENRSMHRIESILGLKPLITSLKENRALPSVSENAFIECLISLKKNDQLDISRIKEKIHEIMDTELASSCLEKIPNYERYNRNEIQPKRNQFINKYILDNTEVRKQFSPVQLKYGGVYEGEWNDKNERHGFGVLTWPNGEKYEGYWLKNKEHGKGTYSFPDGEKYEGEYVNGQIEGYGVYIYSCGDEYEGYWLKNKKHGKGTYSFPNGEKYEGEYVNDQKEGYGVNTYSCGSKYEGEYVNDQKEGYGVFTYSGGSKYEGYWLKNNKHGKGTYSFPDGEKYEGEYVNGKEEGYGVYTKPNGNKYEGEFVNGEYEGYGVFTYSNDDSRYEGYWLKGKKHGRGIIIYKNGKRQEGEWVNGVKQ